MDKNMVTIKLEYPDAHQISRLMDTLDRIRFHLHDLDGSNQNSLILNLIQDLQDSETVKAIDKVQEDLNRQLDYALSEFRYCLQDIGDLEKVEPALANGIMILERLIVERDSVERIAYWIWGIRQLVSKYDFGISQRLDDYVGFYKREVCHVD